MVRRYRIVLEDGRELNLSPFELTGTGPEYRRGKDGKPPRQKPRRSLDWDIESGRAQVESPRITRPQKSAHAGDLVFVRDGP